MRGTIDQVDAFFSGITAAWAKALLMLGSIWGGHLLGLAADSLSWVDGGLQSSMSLVTIVSIPLTSFSTFANCFHWPLFGMMFLLLLSGGLLGIYYAETLRLPISLGVMVAQAWATFIVYRYIIGHYGFLGWYKHESLIGLVLITVLTLACGATAFVAWKRQQ